jgi:hypothetical protein
MILFAFIVGGVLCWVIMELRYALKERDEFIKMIVTAVTNHIQEEKEKKEWQNQH